MNEQEAIKWDEPEQVSWEGETSQQQPSTGYNPLKTIVNFPGSVGRGFAGMAKTITSPVQTGRAMMQAGEGLGQKIERLLATGSPELQKQYPSTPQEQVLGAMAQEFIRPYKSLENFKRTAEEDPARIAWDASSFFTLGGYLSRAAQLGRLGDVLLTLGTKTDPFWMMKESIAYPLSKTTLPEKLYQSAAKMPKSKKWTQERREAATATGLEEGIMPTVQGYQKLREKIDTLNDAIAGAIEARGKTGEAVPTKDLITKYNDWASDFLKDSPHPLEDNKIINDTRMEILARGDKFPIEDAQAIKQNLYKKLDEKYRMKGSTAVEADKAYARFLKEGIVDLAPEIASLNAKDSAYIELMKAIEPAARRIRDRDILGGAWMTWSPKAMMARVISDTPAIKALFAIALARARNIENTNKALTAIRQGMFQAGKVSGLPTTMSQE